MRFSETRTDVLKTGDGQELDIHIWEPEAPKAVIIAIHGGLAHAGDYVTPALYFKEKEIATVSHDLRGHKKKKIYIDSFDQFLDDTVDFLSWTKSAYKDIPIYIMGHSLGSLIAAHFGLKYAAADTSIKGYILSSPYFENAIKVLPIMIPLVKILGNIIPRTVIPSPELTNVLTRDKEITERHHQDEADGLRSKQATMRFGSELLKAQKWIKENFSDWNHPTFAVIAGTDELADYTVSEQMLKSMDQGKLTYVFHKDNYHENFNEVNRAETFDKIYEWMDSISPL